MEASEHRLRRKLARGETLAGIWSDTWLIGNGARDGLALYADAPGRAK